MRFCNTIVVKVELVVAVTVLISVSYHPYKILSYKVCLQTPRLSGEQPEGSISYDKFDYPMPWQSPMSGVTHDIVKLCLAVCRLHELTEEHVCKMRRLFILNILSQVVNSHLVLQTSIRHGAKTFAPSLPGHRICLT